MVLPLIMNLQDAAVAKNAHSLLIRDVRRCYSYFSGVNETYKTLKHFKGKLKSRTELGKSCKNSISPRNPALKKRLEKFDFICAKVKKYLNKEENSEAKVSLIYFKKA